MRKLDEPRQQALVSMLNVFGDMIAINARKLFNDIPDQPELSTCICMSTLQAVLRDLFSLEQGVEYVLDDIVDMINASPGMRALKDSLNAELIVGSRRGYHFTGTYDTHYPELHILRTEK